MTGAWDRSITARLTESSIPRSPGSDRAPTTTALAVSDKMANVSTGLP